MLAHTPDRFNTHPAFADAARTLRGTRRYAADRSPRPANLPLALVVAGHLGIFLLLMSQPGRQMMRESSAIFVTLLQDRTTAASKRNALPAAEPLRQKPLAIAPPSPDLALLPVVISTIGEPASAPTAASSQNSAEASARAPLPAPAQSATPPRFDADYLNNPAPVYPPLSRRMGEEGRVLLRVQVDATGNATALEIRDSSGSQRLDNAAIEAVRRWKFVAAKLGEQNLSAWVLVPINFSLRNGG